MHTVGFIGLGTMGQPMARNLLKAGHKVVFYSRRAEVALDFLAAGGVQATSPAAVTEAAEFVITIVTADAQVNEVVLGPHGIVEGAAQGKMLIDMSTIGPWTVRQIAARLAKAGMTTLDAPVSGGPWGAQAGTLSIMVGGEPADFERATPVLRSMGDKLFHLGPLGAGQQAKLINQMMGGAIMTLIGEALALGKAAGLDLAALADVVAVSSGNSAVFDARGKKFVLADQFEPGFRLDLMRKDVALALEMGRQADVPLPVAAAAFQQYTAAMNQGLAERDFAAVAKVCAQAAGVQLP